MSHESEAPSSPPEHKKNNLDPNGATNSFWLPSQVSLLEPEIPGIAPADSAYEPSYLTTDSKRLSRSDMLSEAFDALRVEDDDNDGDDENENREPIGEDYAKDDRPGSYATSVSSSVRDYRYELGRRFHAYKAGAYFLPNDEAEIKRLDFQHDILKLLFEGELHFAPLSNPKNIIDLGTGTGSWAMEMAEKYPDTMVIGNDLSPIQPNWVPPNVIFEVDDIESPWPYHRRFDLIHARFLSGSIHDWPALFKKAHEFTTPGGWIELKEIDCKLLTDDGTLDPYSPLARWSELLVQASDKFGSSLRIAPKLAEMVKAAGFTNVKQKRYKLPVSPWPKLKHMKEIGAMQMCNMLDGLHAVSIKHFTERLGYTLDELDEFLAEVADDVCNLRIHCYYTVYAIIAQKRA